MTNKKNSIRHKLIFVEPVNKENDSVSFIDKMRMQLWCDVWCAVANAIDCKKPETATIYANDALKNFDIKFPKQEINGTQQ